MSGKELVDKLQELLDSEYPTLEDFNDLIKQISEHGEEGVIEGVKQLCIHSFISCSCVEYDGNEEEVVDIVEVLLDFCPELASVAATKHFGDVVKEKYYPIHAACENGNCPNGVIELLLECNAQGLDHLCTFGCIPGIVESYGNVAGTPLHYYLYWGKRDIDMVKLLVEACPEALTMGDNKTLGFTPLHSIFINSVPDLDVLEHLIQANPLVLRIRDKLGQLPIHEAACNGNVTPEVMKCLIDACPETVVERDWDGDLPFHCFLQNRRWDSKQSTAAHDIMKLFFNAAPDKTVFQGRDGSGLLPIQAAAANHDVDLCKLLVKISPGSERDRNGVLAIVRACMSYEGRAETVRYLAKLYPESIHMAHGGMSPFFHAVCSNGRERADIIRILLEIDPSFAASAAANTRCGYPEVLMPLHTACMAWEFSRPEGSGPICPSPEAVKVLFDYYPAAILARDSNGKNPVELARDALNSLPQSNGFSNDWKRDYFEKIISFLETQFPYVSEANEYSALHEPDENGSLLLHRALNEKSISVGVIKMIVNGYPNAVQVENNRGWRPLQIACINSALDVVQYMLGSNTSLLSNLVDEEGNNSLHLACKGGNCEVMKYLLEEHASLAMTANKMNLLPLHELCDKSRKEIIFRCNGGTLQNSEVVTNHTANISYQAKSLHIEYVDSIWQMLLAYPLAVSSGQKGESKLGATDLF